MAASTAAIMNILRRGKAGRIFFSVCAMGFVLCFYAAGTFAASKSEISIYAASPFYILYETVGPNAVPASDVNDNGVPDSIEAIAAQMAHARQVLHGQMGLRDPLASPRYPDVQRIEVRILDKNRMRGCNGRAFDEPTISRVAPGEQKLSVQIARHIDATRNVTPAHEYFHLVQNGYTYFKNAWYYEGLARYVEGAFQQRAGKDTALPVAQSAAFFDGLSYDAADTLWRPLAALCPVEDAKTQIVDEQETTQKTQVLEQVMPVYALRGVSCMRRMLEQLDVADDAVYAMQQADTSDDAPFWSEARQRSKDNTQTIRNVVREVYGW